MDSDDLQKKIQLAREQRALNEAIAKQYHDLALHCMSQREYKGAIDFLHKAVSECPDFYPAVYNLAIFNFTVANNMTETSTWIQRSLELRPDNGEIYNLLGVFCRDMGNAEEALEKFQYAFMKAPGMLFILHNICLTSNSCTEIPHHVLFEIHQKYGRLFYDGVFESMQAKPITTWKSRLGNGSPVRIGLISGDFFCHSVTYFVSNFLKFHDKNKFHITCYYNHEFSDVKTKELMHYADRWVEVLKLSQEQCAKLVREDGIDILIDLAGHTQSNRLDVLCSKPAPIQMSWIGYCNTTGIPTIDYRLCDAITDPLDTEQQFTEKLIRLEKCFLCYDPPMQLRQLYSSKSPVKKYGYLTFGNFNTVSKINEASFTAWCRVMVATGPSSKLVLKSKCFQDKEYCKDVFERFEQMGVLRHRVILLPRFIDAEMHWKSYHEIDIALDTFHYSGTTTTCEALVMGVPVITLGEKNFHAANVSKSILINIGHPELVASTPEEFVQIAFNLNQDHDRVAALRKSIRNDLLNSYVCNGPEFTRNFEKMLRDVITDYQDKREIESFTI